MKCPSPRNPESPKQDKPKSKHPRHILIKLTKIKHKEQILKAATEKQQTTHKGIPIRITADLSIETLQARREWQDILKVMKENNLQPRLLYPARISFKYERRNQKLYRQAKAPINAKGSSLDRKHRKVNSNPKQQSKWQRDHTYQ